MASNISPEEYKTLISALESYVQEVREMSDTVLKKTNDTYDTLERFGFEYDELRTIGNIRQSAIEIIRSSRAVSELINALMREYCNMTEWQDPPESPPKINFSDD